MEVQRIIEYEEKVLKWLDDLSNSSYKPKRHGGNFHKFDKAAALCTQIACTIRRDILAEDVSELSIDSNATQIANLLETIQSLSSTICQMSSVQPSKSAEPVTALLENSDDTVADEQSQTRVTSLKLIRKAIKSLTEVEWISPELSGLCKNIDFWYDSRFYYKSTNSQFHYNYNTIFQFMAEIVISYCDAVIHNESDVWSKNFYDWCVAVKNPKSEQNKYPVPSFVHIPIQNNSCNVSMLAGKVWEILYTRMKFTLLPLLSTDIVCDAWSSNYLTAKQNTMIANKCSCCQADHMIASYAGDIDKFYGSWHTLYSIYKLGGESIFHKYIQLCNEYGNVTSENYGSDESLKQIIHILKSSLGTVELSKSLMDCVHTHGQVKLLKGE